MKKRIVIGLGVILLMVFSFLELKPSSTLNSVTAYKPFLPAFLFKKKAPEIMSAQRTPAQVVAKDVPKIIDGKKHHKNKMSDIVTGIADLPHGLAHAANVFAVMRDEYSSSMGDKVSENHALIFFKSDLRPQGSINVAFDKANQKFFPITSVVKLENITENIRQELASLGFEENYYHDSLKILYLQSSNDEVLKLFTDLGAMNLKASLEVTRSFHRPR